MASSLYGEEHDKEMRAFRRIGSLEQKYSGRTIQISIRTRASGGGVMRRGAKGRNVYCVICRKQVGYTNESGSVAKNYALEDAGKHLQSEHPDIVETLQKEHAEFLKIEREYRKAARERAEREANGGAE